MKKFFVITLITLFYGINAQETANRFFYQLTFKPKQGSEKLDKVITILDITKEKSIYRDYTMVAQDSIMKVQFEQMQKSGVFKDFTKSVTMPKVEGKVYKFYPDMKVQYVEKITSGFTPIDIGYDDPVKFDWKISNEKQKIGSYNTQKGTTDFGGRTWTAWFTNDIPLQDGPYKFYGLPGLIVKIEDKDKNYSWELKGNKKVEDFSELSFLEKIMPGGGSKSVAVVPREKFEKTYSEYKKDPMGSMKPLLKPEDLQRKLPGSESTVGEMLKNQEKMIKDFYDSNDNPIEVSKVKETGKKSKK